MATTVTAPEPVKTLPLMRRPRVVKLLIIALLAEIAYALLNISTMPVYLKDSRHFGTTGLGYVLVAYLLCEAVFKGPMGHLADRFGPKKLMMIGPSISVATSLLSLIVPASGGKPLEILTFILLRAFDGLGAAMLWPAAFSAVGDAVEDGERQEAMSLLNLCYMLGIAFAFPLGGIINDLSGTTWAALVLASGIFLAVGVAAWQFVPLIDPTTIARSKPGETGLSDFIESVRRIPSYLILATVTFAGIGFPMTIFKLFPMDQFNFSETKVGLLIGPSAIVMGIASVPISRYGEKIGRARAVHLGLFLCTAGMWLVGAGMFLPFLRHPWVLAAGGIPVGLGFLLAIPAWMASVSDINPHCRGVNLGAIMTAQGLGAIVGTPIGSTLYEKLQPVGVNLGLGRAFGRYSPFVGCAACITVGFILSLQILKDRHGIDEEDGPIEF